MAALGQRDILLNIAKAFNKLKIAYLLTGSFAVSYYGLPRATHDIDFIIEIHKENLNKLKSFLNKLGKEYQFDLSDLENPSLSAFQFNIYHPETGIKVDLWMVKDSNFEKSKFRRRKEIIIDKTKIPVISAEDLILNKLLWSKEIASEKHLNDCKGIIQIQGEKLDYKYLKIWAIKLKVNKQSVEALGIGPRTSNL